LDDEESPKNNKIFFGVPEKHAEEPEDVAFLTDEINKVWQ